MSRRKLLLETFEERILCSVTAPADPAADPHHAIPHATATTAATPTLNEPPPAQSTGDAAADKAAATRRELIVVNGNLPDADQLVAELTKKLPAGSFEVLKLDTYRDGVEQITALLAASGEKFDAIHLLGHGDSGYINLGATRLDIGDLNDYAGSIARWGLSLNNGADILFYGCSFASGAAGQQIVQRVAQLTGADVAASTDATGAASLGGNWKLEYSLGSVQSTLGAQPAETVAWSHLLAGTPIDGGIGAFIGVTGNGIYSISFDTGKATLLGNSNYVNASGTLNSAGTDSVNGIFYYADSANGSKSIYGFDLHTGQQFVVAADVTTFGVTLPGAGMGAAGGDFAGGNYYFSTEGGGPNGRDQIYKVTFTAGSNGRTVQSIALVNNIDGSNEFGDFIIVPGGTTKLWSFNSGTSVDEYNTTGTGTNLTYVQRDSNSGVSQAAIDRNGNLYTVGTTIRTYNPAGAGTFGSALNITTDGTTGLATLADGSSYVPAESSIGDRVWYDADLDGVQDAGETGVVGVTVSLYDDLNGNGALDAGERLLATATTGANGAYLFGQLLPGDYLIQVTDPTSIMKGAASTTGGTLQTASINLVGQAVLTKDFGFEQPATITVSSPSVSESGGFAVFTVSLSNQVQNAVSLNLALANGTATGGGTDYGAGGATNLQVSTDGGTTWNNATTATIPAGSTSVLVRTPIINDALDEANETFSLTATRTAGLTANNSASGTATITDDDPTPSLTINDVTVNEATGTATFTVTLSAASGQNVTVNYATSNGTATAGSDYTSKSGTLTFTPGVVTQTVTISILNDTVFENSETFNVNLSAAVNASIADNLGVGTIRDDGTGTGGTDNDTPTISVSSPAVTEGTDSFAVFTVSLTNASTAAIGLNLALANVTATGGGTDYGAAGATNLQVSTNGGATWTNATTATIAAGTTSVLVRTPIINDALAEPSETFTLTATRTSGTTTNGSAAGTATIADNDAPPTLSINDITINEGAGTATFTVTLSAASGQNVTVNYATSNGTATAGSDYTSTSGALTFTPGILTQTITVPILNDAVFENSETFNVNLSGAVNATIADNLGVGTIRDDGTGSGGTDNDTPTISVTSPAVTEGTDNFAVFTVSLSRTSTTPVSVSLALANITATGTGTDYGAGGATNLQVSTDGGTTWTNATSATIAAGSTSVLVRTPLVNDTLDEAVETFTLTATRTAGTTTNTSAVGTATITDNDPAPSLSINDLTVNEGAGTATFTVTLNTASGQNVSVNYATSNGSATAGADYTSTTGTLTFTPGVVSQTITVPILNDAVFENSEFFNVNLNGAVNASIADNLGVGTIRDDGTGTGGTDNDTPTLNVSSPTVTEGTDNFAVFTVSVSGTSTSAVSFNLGLTNGTATGGGTDYGASGPTNLQVSTDGGATWNNATSATIAAGATSVLVRTPILNDALDETAETFTLTATRTAGTTTNLSATGTGTINDDDPTPSLTINDITVNEGAGTATFTVTLDAPSGRAVSVNYATSNGTATAGADYTSVAGTVTFNPGVITQTITVPILNDAVFENSETFNVLLSTAVNATITDNSGLATIRDDGTGTGGADNDTPILSVSNVTVTEGLDTHAVFAVSLSNTSTTAIVVNLALANVSATGGGTDYGAGGATNLQVSTDGGTTWGNATSATIAAGATSVLVRTPITNDTLNEAAETFTLTATRTGGITINAAATGTATITDNDPLPALSINDVTVNEGAGTATFTVTLNAPSGQAVAVGYATSNGTAAAGADFTAATGSLNFAAGVTSQTITVAILNDTIYENSESFSVLLSGAINATISDGTGLGTILDDGTGPGGTDNDTPSLSVSNVTVTEGVNPHAIFAVSLSNASTTPVSVNLALANGTATGGGVDYGAALEVSTNGGTTWTAAASATIAPGATSVLVRTPIINDALDEAAETFTLTATRTAGTTANAGAMGTATINDDDPTPSLTINDVTVNEAAGTATFTVTLSATSGQAVSVNYASSSGTATAGADFTGIAGTLNFAAGVTTQTITIPIINDPTYEGSESFNVTLSGAVNATIADAAGLGTILDDGTGGGGSDNDLPVLAVSNPSVTEGTDGFAVFTVSLSNPSAIATTVSLTPANGTALGGGSDYGTGGAGNLQVSLDGGTTWADATSATFAPGSTSVLVRTPITNDSVSEPLETFSLTAATTAGSTRNANAIGTGTIVDDDGAPSVTIDDVTVNEAAGTATFTVRLTSVSALPISVDYTTTNGTATAGTDFTTAGGTLNFTPGVTSQTVTVTILNDSIFENSESFNVLLSNAVNAFIVDDTGIGTILDNGSGPGGTDNDTPALSVSNVGVTEGTDPHAIFAVSLSNLSTTPVSVSLALANGTALGGGVDYGAGLEVSIDGGTTWNPAASATIAAGFTSVLVRTPIVNDALDEAPETFTLTATRTAGSTTNLAATGTATITDDDPSPSLTINDVTVNEATGTATFTVTLNAVSGQAVSVAYATASGTATAGADFTSTSGTLNFAAGVTTQIVTVPILNDTTFEGSENFTVVLSSAINAAIADNAGLGTILDDGTGSGGSDNDTPTLAVSSTTVVEGTDNFAVFTVSLTNPAAAATTVNLALTNGSATGGGTDFGSAGANNLEVSTDGGSTWTNATSATFVAGATSLLVRTPIVDDALNEASEDFTLTATVTAGTTTNASATGTGTIGDDDGQPTLSINDVTVNEAAGTATFTVTLNAASGLPVTVSYATSNGTAAAGSDYTAASGLVLFSPGQTSKTVTISITDDTVFEKSESFNVVLSAPTFAIIADDTGIGTILDDGTGPGGTDNDTPTLSVSNVSVTEGINSHAVFSIDLSNTSTTPVSVGLALANGSALGAGTDFGAGGAGNLQISTDGGTTWVNATTATIAAGQTSILARTPVTDDALAENAENFTLTATVTGGTTTNSSATGTGTILDNDAPPGLSINDVTVNEAAGTATFTVTLNVASGLPVSVNYATGNGTALVVDDFTGTSGILNFAPGVISQTVTVSIVNDAIFEGSENFNVLLSGAVNASITDGTGVGTILDDGTGPGGTDNDTPTLAVSNVSVTEGTDTHAVFIVSLSNLSTTPVSVNLALANGSATGTGTDFGPGLEVSTDGGTTWVAAGSATIAAGSSSVRVRTPITDDALDEFSEDFTLTATVTAGATLNASATGIATIADNDPTPSLSIDDVTVNEGAGTMTFTVSLSAASGLAVSVNYATANGTATAVADYTGTSGTLNFAPGVTSQTVTISIVNDTIFEQSENLSVLLNGAVNATIADNTGAGTILDDGTGPGGTDNDTPTFTISNDTATEGSDTHAVFAVNLSNPSTTAVSLNLALSDGTALGGGVDYGTALEVSTDGGTTWAPSSSTTFTPGATSVLVRTPIINDTINEAPETFTLTATLTAGTTLNATATGTATILDNDGLPALSIDDVTVNEGAGTATFTVTLNGPSGQAITVNYGTSNGTALAGADFTAALGTLNFAPGVTSQTVTVPILNDTTFEGSENFNVLLSSPVNATIADATGLGTILDDGNGNGGSDNDTPSLSVSNVTVTEGTNTHAVFAVSLSNLSTTDVSFNLALANGTATGGGTDFGAALEISTDGGTTWTAASSATIAAGSASVLVRTPITNDTISEAAETFTLTATKTAGTTTNVASTGTATILDNDTPPTLSINDVTVNEGAGTATFTVTLSAASEQTVNILYATNGGTAAAGVDFTTSTGSLSFAPGVITQTVTVAITNDEIFEGSENFTVTLASPVNATIADGIGIGTILDDGTGSGGSDDDTPIVSVSSVSVTEGTDSHAIFSVNLSNASTTPVGVSLALVDGTAVGSGTDFGSAIEVSTDGGTTWVAASSATIAAGSTEVLVRTPIVDDPLDEAAENFTLTATVTSGTTVNASANGIGTIVDDDGPPSLSIDNVTVNEGAGTATFTVNLSAPAGQLVKVNYVTSNGTALAGLDYSSKTGTLNFAAGVVSQTITISILNDAIFEQSEWFTVLLNGAVNATIAGDTGLGTILDDGTGGGGSDNDTPTLSVSNVAVTEGIDSHAVFAVSLSNLSTTPVDVSLALANGTATGGGTDFGPALEVSTDGGTTWTALSNATIAAGSTSVLVRTPIINDAINEFAEDFTLTATVTGGATTNASATGTATITDNDPLPTLTINDVTVNEAAGTATFTVTLSTVSGRPISVDYATGNGSALAGADFTSTSGTLNFAIGATTQTITVPILNDSIFEQSESFNVLLSAPVNATITDGTGTGTILDDGTGSGGSDNDTPTLSVSNVTVTEGVNSHAIFTLSLSNLSTTPVTVNLALANGSAIGGGTDFGPDLEVSTDGGANWVASSSATIAAGSTSVLARTPIVDDPSSEPTETFTLTATVAAGTTTNLTVTGTATILDNDALPTLSIDDLVINESDGTATFTVTLDAASGLPISVNFATSNGAARAGSDYLTQSGILNFAPGVTSQTVTITILDDALFENPEAFQVTLSGEVNATIDDGSGTATILDDDVRRGSLSLISTSDAGTAGSHVAVGEVVTYELQLELAEGANDNLILWDQLPVGLQFLPNAPVIVGYNNVNSSVTGLASGSYTNASADAMISASQIANDDIYSDGTNVFFKLGSLLNNDSDADREFVTIRFSAVVTNSTQNQAGTLHDNTFSPLLDTDGNGSAGFVSIDRDGDNTATGTEIANDPLNDASGTPAVSDTVTTTVAEPILVLDKQITSAPAVIKAGDTIIYTVTISHAAGSDATAWEATLADLVPAGLQFTQIDSVTLAGGAQPQTAATIGGGGATLGGAWDIPVGGSVTVVYRATVTSGAVLGSTLNNLADLTWSSVDGISPNERGSGNGLLGGGGLNDYELQQSAGTTIDGGANEFSLDKQILGSSTAEIGARLTYQLTLKVADGIINSISLHDLIPAGFSLVNGSANLVSGAGVTTNGVNFTYASNQLTLDIAQLQSSVDGIENTITITYTVDVLDSAANDAFGGGGASTKINLADAGYDPGSGPITAQDSATVNLVEPVVTASESVTAAPAKPNAGDTITFQVVIGHTGASTGNAYNVVYTDTLPAAFGNVQLTGISGNAAMLPSVSDFMVLGNTILTANPFDLGLGEEVVLTYTAVIQDTVRPGEILTNNALITAQSTDLSPSGNARSSGSATNGAHYQATGAATLTADATFDLAKIANVSTARIGDRIHYTITVNVIEGTTPSLILTDNLPGGPAIDSASIQIAYGAPGMNSSNGSPASIAGNTLTLDFATLTNPGDNIATNDTITIEYDEVIGDNAGNQNGNVKINTVSGTYTGLGTPATASASVTLEESVLDIQKSVNDDTPHLGQTVTYTLVISHNGASTTDAFDLTLNDPLPPGVSLNAASIQLVGAPAGTTITSNTSTNGGALQLGLNQLALGESVTITFTATVTTDPAAIGGTFGGGDDTLTSSVALDYDSQAGANANQRTYSGSAAQALTVVGGDLAVTIDDGQPTANAGDRLTYTITVTNNGTDTATNVALSQLLPLGGAFNAALSSAGGTTASDTVLYTIPSLAAGATTTLTVVVDLVNPTPPGLESIISTVDVTHDDIEPTPADNTASDTDTLLSAPNYQITVTDNRTSAKPGETWDYTITVTNVGNQDGTGVTVNDIFSTGIFASMVADHGGVVDLANGTVAWNVGDLAAGSSVTLTLHGTVNATFTTIPVPVGTPAGAVPDNDAIAHTVSVTDDGLGGADSDPANNTATDLDDLQPVPELKVTTTDNVTTAKPGQMLTYTIVATNVGTQDSNGMIVTDTLPKGVKLVGIASSDPALTGTPVLSGQTITWNFTGTMAAGASVTFTVVVKVNANVPENSELVNRATIADDGFYGPDAISMSDNTATDTDTVPDPPPVTPAKPKPTPLAPAPAPFVFAFDTFHNFSEEAQPQRFGTLPRMTPIDLSPAAILPLVPIYSGAADPGATLVVTLYNSRGEEIGTQTVMADSGGNWLATFPSTEARDVPNSVRISEIAASYSLGDSHGHNLRTYFSPAINPGHFFFSANGGASLGDESAPLLGGLGLENPLDLGNVKYSGELLGTQASASGY